MLRFSAGTAFRPSDVRRRARPEDDEADLADARRSILRDGVNGTSAAVIGEEAVTDVRLRFRLCVGDFGMTGSPTIDMPLESGL